MSSNVTENVRRNKMYACHPSEKMDTLFKSHYVNTICALYGVCLVNHTMLNTSLIINYFNMII